MTAIHCFSCGRNTVAQEVPQKLGKPIKRCRNCHSLNFRPLHETIEKVDPLEDYRPVLEYLKEREKKDHAQQKN